MKQYYTIPIFVPELACPHRCIFCNQHTITSVQKAPTMAETNSIIEKYLSTIPLGKQVDIGFLGGNFTGIPLAQQKQYLETAQPYLKKNLVRGIRVSTRPDYISEDILQLLKTYGVTTIELGAQSMDTEVLQRAGRGHSIADTENAARMIRESEIELGLQMMTGLPGDTPEKSIHTAKRIVALGASCTRIYPTLVVKDTNLAEWWKTGKYKPQTMHEAIELTSTLLDIFNAGDVTVLRIGLHPTEGFLSGDQLLDGPFHPSFKALVFSHQWKKRFEHIEKKSNNITIRVHPKDIPHAVGHQSKNKNYLLQHFHQVDFHQDKNIKPGAFHVDYR